MMKTPQKIIITFTETDSKLQLSVRSENVVTSLELIGLLEMAKHSILRNNLLPDHEEIPAMTEMQEQNQSAFDEAEMRHEALSIPLNDLDLSVRTYNSLMNYKGNITILADIVRMKPKELLKIPNMNKSMLKEIEKMIVMFGLHLGFPVEDYGYPNNK